MTMSNVPTSRAWVEIDLGAIRENYLVVRQSAGDGAAVIPMVKCGCYGLRTPGVLRVLEALEPWGYGVATVAEGLELRAAGPGRPAITRPILVVAPVAGEDLPAAAHAGLTISVSGLEALDGWARAAEGRPEPLDFHVEIDTGMGRSGFDWRETARWAPAIAERLGRNLRWTGVFTHFLGADLPDGGSAATQWQRFHDALAQLPVSAEDLVVHAANGAASVRWSRFSADAVRPGLFLYGGHPMPDEAPARFEPPRPVVSLRARVVLLRDVPPGTTAGYAATYVARRWERWGTLSIGYGDGLPRALGNRGAVLVRGVRVPIIGRLSMDMVVVDLSDVPGATLGDTATLIGRDGDAEITLEEVAELAGTINYEILTGLSPRLVRVEVEA
jgi:alanine racemase